MGTVLMVLAASEPLGGDWEHSFVVFDASNFLHISYVLAEVIIGAFGLVAHRGIAGLNRKLVCWEGRS